MLEDLDGKNFLILIKQLNYYFLFLKAFNLYKKSEISLFLRKQEMIYD
jgi:hypothetical protein